MGTLPPPIDHDRTKIVVVLHKHAVFYLMIKKNRYKKEESKAPTKTTTTTRKPVIPTKAPIRTTTTRKPVIPTKVPKTTPKPVKETLPTKVPTRSPIVQLPPPVLEDPLFLRLKSIIAPTSTDLAKFNSMTSPQTLAFKWIQKDSYSKISGLSLQRIIERYALAVFYYGNNGKNWKKSSCFSFLTEGSICSWQVPINFFGENSTCAMTAGVYCVGNEVVHSFYMSNRIGRSEWTRESTFWITS